VYVRGGAAGDYFVTASVTGLSSASIKETVTSAPAASVSFTTLAQSASANACSEAVGVAINDAFGNAAPLPAGMALALAAPASLGLYSDKSCAVALPLDGALLVASDGKSAQFWFKGAQPGRARVTVWLDGAASASQDEEIQ
jgi:hypothetical protein